ncbi:MAG: NAD(P)/FAD-dependent oxidoreductase [Gemmataceae bacterium]
MSTRHRVVIVGGGFGGLYAARALRKAPVDVTLIDRRNFHLFQPLLYQVATGGLSPANIAAPLRAVLRRQRNTSVLLGTVVDFDLARREVILTDGTVPYDSLIVATGSWHHYFGHPEWERFAPGLKTVEDATAIRRKVLTAFEQAEKSDDPVERQACLTFVIVGGGPTGVELAGAVAELACHTLRDNFRRIHPDTARVLLLEAGERVLPTFPADLSARAEQSLRRLGVTVRTRTAVVGVAADRVTVRDGNGTDEVVTRTVLWGAGVEASPLARLLAGKCGATVDRSGRVVVTPECTLPGHPEVFVIGDMAHFPTPAGRPLPGVAQTAMQMGAYAARLIERRLDGKPSPGPFVYNDLGSMATIGRNAAVADLGWLRLSGYPAWLAWLFIHVLYLIEFENRVLVLFQWAWNYLTRGRAARLITGDEPTERK